MRFRSRFDDGVRSIHPSTREAMDGWMDGWMIGQLDGQTDCVFTH